MGTWLDNIEITHPGFVKSLLSLTSLEIGFWSSNVMSEIALEGSIRENGSLAPDRKCAKTEAPSQTGLFKPNFFAAISHRIVTALPASSLQGDTHIHIFVYKCLLMSIYVTAGFQTSLTGF